jgi:hypothetical protein
LRVKGRFVKKEDELLMRDLMSLTWGLLSSLLFKNLWCCCA